MRGGCGGWRKTARCESRADLKGRNGCMIVEYDTEVPPPREHPWTVVEANPEARYWDFRAQPEHIPLVLEDFKPWSRYPAIPRFYELLTDRKSTRLNSSHLVIS